MDDTQIIAVFVVIDDVLRQYGHQQQGLAQASAAEVLTVAVVAARYFHNHHARALAVLQRLHFLSGPLRAARFNRRLQRLANWRPFRTELLGRLLQGRACLVIDSMPVPVSRRVRAWVGGTVRGREFCGYCAAKKAQFCGWRLHPVCTPEGVPVRFGLRPVSYQDVTPVHELLWEWPPGVWVLGDKGYVSAPDAATLRGETGIELVAQRRDNQTPNSWAERQALELYRHTIETVNSQAEKMGLERRYARTNAGFAIKVTGSVLALIFSNIHKIPDEASGLPVAWAA